MKEHSLSSFHTCTHILEHHTFKLYLEYSALPSIFQGPPSVLQGQVFSTTPTRL